jgi:hypothetical protein
MFTKKRPPIPRQKKAASLPNKFGEIARRHSRPEYKAVVK